MNIVKATLIKQATDDGLVTVAAPIGKEYLVDLNTIEERNPGFHGTPGLHAGQRLTVLTVCEDCRGHYVGQFAVELLRIEANA